MKLHATGRMIKIKTKLENNFQITPKDVEFAVNAYFELLDKTDRILERRINQGEQRVFGKPIDMSWSCLQNLNIPLIGEVR